MMSIQPIQATATGPRPLQINQQELLQVSLERFEESDDLCFLDAARMRITKPHLE